MKKLLSCLGLASALTLMPTSSSAYEYKIINDKDVPYPTLNQDFIWAPSGIFSEIIFNVNRRKTKLRFKLIDNGSTKDGLFYFGYRKPFSFSADINCNGEIEKEEEFVIDYKNSRLINPIKDIEKSCK